jgi:hypothetical protein
LLKRLFLIYTHPNVARPIAKPIVLVEAVSPTSFTATICGLPSVDDLLYSIDQVLLLSDVLEAFGGVGLTANRPPKEPLLII